MPKLSNASHETFITQPTLHKSKKFGLSIGMETGGGKYLYDGTQKSSEACALIYHPESQSFILDKISAEFTFNLCSTPTIADAQALAAKYPHLDVGESDPESNSDNLFDGNEPQTAEVDVNNPYDYRNFFKRRRTSSPEPLNSHSPPFKSSPHRIAPRQKLKPRPRPYHKRAPSPPPREEADADNEDSDDGGLTIEMDPDTKPRRFNGIFSHDARNGPISLRSAASSVSPVPAIEESSESDEDVEAEEIVFDEPAAGTVQTPGEEENEDERSLEAELEQALESQADEEDGGGVHVLTDGVMPAGVEQSAVVNRIVEESSSSSEEE